MLRIRDDVMAALSAAQIERFEARVIKHISEFFPEKISNHNPEQIRALISQARISAEAHGLLEENLVAKYIDLVILLGLDFNKGSQYPWASAILGRSDLAPNDRLQELLDRIRQAGSDKTSEPGVGERP